MSATPAKLTSVAPVLLVKDVVAAANHYRDKMGFTYKRFWGEPPSFVILNRDGMQLMLKQADDPRHVVPHWTVADKLWNVYFWVNDVESLHKEFVASRRNHRLRPLRSTLRLPRIRHAGPRRPRSRLRSTHQPEIISVPAKSPAAQAAGSGREPAAGAAACSRSNCSAEIIFAEPDNASTRVIRKERRVWSQTT